MALNHSRTHKYLNFIIENSSSSNMEAIGRVERASPIINDPKNYLLSLDRFFINHCELPVWKPKISSSNETELSFILKDINSGNEYNGTVETDKPLFYSIQEVAKAINDCFDSMMTALNGAESTTYNAPIFTVSKNLFTITTDSTFRDNIEVYFNRKAMTYLNTFEFLSIDPTNDTHYALLALTDDEIIQNAQTAEQFSPVQKILMRCSLPIIPEYTPERNSLSSISSSSQSILTDYVFFSDSYSPIKIINYVADGNHRWISMTEATDIRSFNFRCFWVDKEGVQYPLLLPPDSKIDVKMLFNRISE